MCKQCFDRRLQQLQAPADGNARMQRQLPQPPDAGLLNAVRFGTDPFRFLEGVQSRFESIAAVPIPGRAPLVVVTDPELAHDVLARPPEFRRVAAQGSAQLIAENGVVQSDGDLWQQQRGIMRPAFAGKQVKRYANTVGERVEELAAEWRDADGIGTTIGTDGNEGEGERRNLHREMTTLTIRVASEILLGEDVGRERAAQFHEWMAVAGREFEFSPTTVSPAWLPDRTDPEFREAAEGIRGLAEEIIERRRAELAGGHADGNGAGSPRGGDTRSAEGTVGAERPQDMLTLLIEAEDDPGVEYEPNQIRDEVATFLIAGHETTALSLTYTLSLLAWHPEARERVRKEAQHVFGGGGMDEASNGSARAETPGYGHVDDLAYAERAYREALRLYPPAWATFRQTSADVRLGDFRVPDGSAVVLPQYSIQRDGRYFDRPAEFDPDRWEGRSPNGVPAYFPFASGPHACIGRNFALSGATLALSRLTREFDIDVPEDALSDLRPTPTLRPAGEVPVTIRPAQ
jgi:cytochrome P450